MPSNKTKVASYLNDAEEKALLEFTGKEGMSNSEAVNFLIRKQLIEKDKKETADGEKVSLLVNQIVPDEQIKKTSVQLGRQEEFLEKLEEQVTELRERVERLYIQNTERSLEPISDEQIAAITHQPEWKVRLWRHGQMKPRGKRIKERLEPFCVKEGRWGRVSKNEQQQ